MPADPTFAAPAFAVTRIERRASCQAFGRQFAAGGLDYDWQPKGLVATLRMNKDRPPM